MWGQILNQETIDRWYGRLTFTVAPSSVDVSRVQHGTAPFTRNHVDSDVRGRVLKAGFQDERLLAEFVCDSGERGQELEREIRAGKLGLSPDMGLDEIEIEEGRGWFDDDVHCSRSTLLALSSVSVPAIGSSAVDVASLENNPDNDDHAPLRCGLPRIRSGEFRIYRSIYERMARDADGDEAKLAEHLALLRAKSGFSASQEVEALGFNPEPLGPDDWQSVVEAPSLETKKAEKNSDERDSTELGASADMNDASLDGESDDDDTEENPSSLEDDGEDSKEEDMVTAERTRSRMDAARQIKDRLDALRLGRSDSDPIVTQAAIFAAEELAQEAPSPDNFSERVKGFVESQPSSSLSGLGTPDPEPTPEPVPAASGAKDVLARYETLKKNLPSGHPRLEVAASVMAEELAQDNPSVAGYNERLATIAVTPITDAGRARMNAGGAQAQLYWDNLWKALLEDERAGSLELEYVTRPAIGGSISAPRHILSRMMMTRQERALYADYLARDTPENLSSSVRTPYIEEMRDFVGEREREALAVTNTTNQANAIQTDIMRDLVVEYLLDPAAAPLLAMITYYEGDAGPFRAPREDAIGAAAFVTEGNTIAAQNSTLSQMSFTPHEMQYQFDVTRRARQETAGWSAQRGQVNMRLARTLKTFQTMCTGSGASGEPTGIYNITGLSAYDYGDIPTTTAIVRSKLVDTEAKLRESNLNTDDAAWLLSDELLNHLEVQPYVANSDKFLAMPMGVNWLMPGLRLDTNVMAFTVNYKRAFYTTSVFPADKYRALYGVWDQVVMATWGDIEMTFDPYSTPSNIKVTSDELMDFNIMRLKGMVKFSFD